MMDATWEDIGRTPLLNTVLGFCEFEHDGTIFLDVSTTREWECKNNAT